MVFSQTSHKAHSVLKVVDLNRLKPDKSQEVNGLNGGLTGGVLESMPRSPEPTTSFSEEYLKQEPLYEGTMFNNTDCEFFQDLVQWCSAPDKEEQVQTIDYFKQSDARASNTDTTNTYFSPKGWEPLDANSPGATSGFTMSTDPLSPMDNYMQYDNKFQYSDLQSEQMQFNEKFLDISSLPVVIGDFPSKTAEPAPWTNLRVASWPDTLDTNDNKTDTITHEMPITIEDDSFDMKLESAMPREEVAKNVVLLGGYSRRPAGRPLTVNVAARPAWPGDVISTPEVLSYVEQLEKEKYTPPTSKLTQSWTPPEPDFVSVDTCNVMKTPPAEYEPNTPQSESHVESEEDVKPLRRKRRRDSEDSDDSYTPYVHTPTRKSKKRKPSIPIKDMIMALEGSRQPVRRGRPPKRRVSTVSSVCSIDETSSNVSTSDNKYRVLRDKNNEASKRSRMNRKLKELQMEQLAEELEEKNKKLQVKADILEDMTKRLKDALMNTILQK